MKKINLCYITVLFMAVPVFIFSCGEGGGSGPLEDVTGPGWGTAEIIETGPGDAGAPQVAFDANGNALAVWQQWDGTRNNNRASWYVPGAGWGTPELIETDDSGSTLSPQVTVDSGGNAIAVWRQGAGTLWSIQANRYAAGTGWGTEELIETDDSGSTGYPQLAMDSGGNAIVVWEQRVGTTWSILANRYVAGSGWGTAELIETADSGDAHAPQVAMDSGGNALVVWYQSDGIVFNILANWYVAGLGWGTAALIETDNSISAHSPQVAFDSSGNAMALWVQGDATRDNIWANRYVAGTGWGTAELLETGSGDAQYPQVAMDSGGNAIAVWRQWDGTRASIWANQYVAGSGWGTAELIEKDNSGDAYAPQVAMDSGGNAIAIWHQTDRTRFSVRANRFQY